jgi:hypothetical protein
VAEADESDGSFLLLQPVVALVTNIDRDHLDAYEQSFDNLRKAFLEFLHHLPFYGAAVLCVDDPNVADLIPSVTRAVVTYGLAEQADLRATEIRQQGRMMHFLAHLPGRPEPLAVSLNLPGVRPQRPRRDGHCLGAGPDLPPSRRPPPLRRRPPPAEVGQFAPPKGKVMVVETMATIRRNWPPPSRPPAPAGPAAASWSCSSRTATAARATCSTSSRRCWRAATRWC